MDKNKLYRENMQIIKKAAKYTHLKTGIELDDLECEGNLIFCECCEKYDHSKGEFSNYLKTALKRGFTRYVNKEKTFTSEEFQDQITDNSWKIEAEKIIQNYYNNISADCQYIYDLIFSDKLFNDTKVYKSNRITKEKIKRHLRSEGWKYTRIEKAFSDIKTAIQL